MFRHDDGMIDTLKNIIQTKEKLNYGILSGNYSQIIFTVWNENNSQTDGDHVANMMMHGNSFQFIRNVYIFSHWAKNMVKFSHYI